MNVLRFEKTNCKNCYKCVRVCPVKSIIIKDENAEIMPSDCILCGRCIARCPQNAKTVQSDLSKVKKYILDGKRVYASVAPSYLSSFALSRPGQLVRALKRLGFHGVSETAVGAQLVTDEYRRLLQSGEMENIIATCCTTVNELIEKYYPDLIPYLAPTVSPMIAHARKLRRDLGSDIKVVFIGPCISKKREARDMRNENDVNAVITFRELEQWMEEKEIEPAALEAEPFLEDTGVTRIYPTCGGVIRSIRAAYDIKGYNTISTDGMENCMEALDAVRGGGLKRCFIELLACDGGCINGPAIAHGSNQNKFKAILDVKDYAKKKHKRVEYSGERDALDLHKVFFDKSKAADMPSEEEIRAILRKIGKETPEQELNCGFCGYPSCREKAVAVYRGKAQLSMCLPYMNARAQSFSNIVLAHSPNMILAVDRDMRVLEMNNTAQTMFKTPPVQYLYELIDTRDVEAVFETGENIYDKIVPYPALDLVTEQSIVYTPENDIVIAIFKDVTRETQNEEKAYRIKLDTIEMAQKVINKQMLVAQRIASLLGETTAETKVTLTRLKDTIIYDGEKKE